MLWRSVLEYSGSQRGEVKLRLFCNLGARPLAGTSHHWSRLQSAPVSSSPGNSAGAAGRCHLSTREACYSGTSRRDG